MWNKSLMDIICMLPFRTEITITFVLVHCTALNVVIEQFLIFNIGKITFVGSVADLISAIISKLLCPFVN